VSADRQRLAIVDNHSIGLRLRLEANAVALAYEDDMEGAARQHARKRAVTSADGEAALCLAPLDRDGGEDALLAGVALALVFSYLTTSAAAWSVMFTYSVRPSTTRAETLAGVSGPLSTPTLEKRLRRIGPRIDGCAGVAM
jgi:hypothetical protein